MNCWILMCHQRPWNCWSFIRFKSWDYDLKDTTRESVGKKHEPFFFLRRCIITHFSLLSPVAFRRPFSLHRRGPPTPLPLWSIRLSVRSQKWLWHLLQRPAECSGLKGDPKLWPETARFLFFLPLPSIKILLLCTQAFTPQTESVKDFALPTRAFQWQPCACITSRCTKAKKKPAATPFDSDCCRPSLSARLQYLMSAPKTGFQPEKILLWPVLTSRKTITAPVASGGQQPQNFGVWAAPRCRCLFLFRFMK